MIPSVAAPGDTNPSDATARILGIGVRDVATVHLTCLTCDTVSCRPWVTPTLVTPLLEYWELELGGLRHSASHLSTAMATNVSTLADMVHGEMNWMNLQ